MKLVLHILVAGSALLASPLAAQRLARPFVCDSCISNWNYYDHNDGAALDDWNCGISTYNGHGGSDYAIRGGVDAIDRGYRVRAAADGVVIDVEDGHPDRCRIVGLSDCESGASCTFTTANFVAIRHENRTTRYVHLRRGSVRVGMGDRVRCGDILGEIGSSGCSTNAHLHFEVRPRDDSRSSRYDPYRGTCSPRTTSLWIRQGGYRGYPGLECPVEPPPPTPDAGPAPSDAGPMTEPDAGPITEPDAGTATDTDAGPIGESDAGEGADAGRTSRDAGRTALDAGRGPETRAMVTGGCGCHATPAPTGPAALSLLLLLALRRRR